jgi:hypothetical protein
MWSTQIFFITNLTPDGEKLRLKWLVRALEIYEVRGFYRGLKLRYEPHAVGEPAVRTKRERARAPYLSWLDLPPDILARPFAYPLLSSGLPLDNEWKGTDSIVWKHSIRPT